MNPEQFCLELNLIACAKPRLETLDRHIVDEYSGGIDVVATEVAEPSSCSPILEKALHSLYRGERGIFSADQGFAGKCRLRRDRRHERLASISFACEEPCPPCPRRRRAVRSGRNRPGGKDERDPAGGSGRPLLAGPAEQYERRRCLHQRRRILVEFPHTDKELFGSIAAGFDGDAFEGLTPASRKRAATQRRRSARQRLWAACTMWAASPLLTTVVKNFLCHQSRSSHGEYY